MRSESSLVLGGDPEVLSAVVLDDLKGGLEAYALLISIKQALGNILVLYHLPSMVNEGVVVWSLLHLFISLAILMSGVQLLIGS